MNKFFFNFFQYNIKLYKKFTVSDSKWYLVIIKMFFFRGGGGGLNFREICGYIPSMNYMYHPSHIIKLGLSSHINFPFPGKIIHETMSQGACRN